MTIRKICIVESPYAARAHDGVFYTVEDNKAYLQKAIRHAIAAGYAPFASHQMYTDALDDSIPAERALGMSMLEPYLKIASVIRFYVDRGLSSGMQHAMDLAQHYSIPVLMIKLDREK